MKNPKKWFTKKN